jgi:hypothetical protein
MKKSFAFLATWREIAFFQQSHGWVHACPLAGKVVRMPPDYNAFRKAERIKKSEGRQGDLGI